MFGSLDVNRGDPQLGWDTDQFPNSVAEVAQAFYYLFRDGGLGTGGLNFDAKVRRQSLDPADLLHAIVTSDAPDMPLNHPRRMAARH